MANISFKSLLTLTTQLPLPMHFSAFDATNELRWLCIEQACHANLNVKCPEYFV